VLIQLLVLAGHALDGRGLACDNALSATLGAVMMVTMSNMFDLDAPPAGAVWAVATLVFAVVVIPLLFFIFA